MKGANKMDYAVGILLFGFGMVVGIILMGIVLSTGSTEVVRADALNQVCHEIYGRGYEWHDNHPGSEVSIVCRYKIKPIDR